MVTKALPQDKAQVLALWKEAFSFDDGGYTKFFFDRYYRNHQTFVLKEDNTVISSAIKTPHSLMLHGKMIQASMIVGVATKEDHRHQGHFHRLMNAVLDECEHQELVTLIQAYDPELYKEFGFEVVYKRKQILIKRADVPQLADTGITYRLDFKNLMKVYSQFTAKFDGVMMRDENYFRDLAHEVEAQGGKSLRAMILKVKSADTQCSI
ncbi:MAG: GNAT family N-acetyltransferase [Erysipelotrichaceae bacterium]|nr:GNAT family N-acetyltransferase [Erysipelotrichaceae bacterium]